MSRKQRRTYAAWILLTEAVGALSALLTRDGSRFYSASVVKPPLSPSAIVFPIVWTILFALMGIGAARIALSKPSVFRTRALRLYFVQLAFNFLWSILFFNLRNFCGALIWLLALWGLILWMLLTFRRVERTAGHLQIPYLAWVSFAAYLNLGVCLLN